MLWQSDYAGILVRPSSLQARVCLGQCARQLMKEEFHRRFSYRTTNGLLSVTVSRLVDISYLFFSATHTICNDYNIWNENSYKG